MRCVHTITFSVTVLMHAVLVGCGVGAAPTTTPTANPAPETGAASPPTGSTPTVLNIAHRGYSGVAPENTLVAVQRAIDAGADMVEIDVQMSADGEIVVMHDTSLTRTTDAETRYPTRVTSNWSVDAFTLDEMMALDAGSWYAPEFAGEPVPSLRQVLDLLADNSGLLLEVKSPDRYPGIEMKIAEDLEAAGWVVNESATQVLVVQSFDWESMRTYANLHRDVRIGLLGNPPDSEEVWADVATFADDINPGHGNVDQALVDAVHARGFGINPYTVNDEARMRELIALGVDGIITDQVETMNAARDPADR